MKTIFDKETRDDLIKRINSLPEHNTPQWGKMNIYQMVKHNCIWNAWILGKIDMGSKQGFLGYIFGKKALKSLIGDERPMKKNMPAGSKFTVKEKSGDLALQKKLWAELLEGYESFSNHGFVHDFFGKMTKEEIGLLAYKHTDHHLRQFNA